MLHLIHIRYINITTRSGVVVNDKGDIIAYASLIKIKMSAFT